MARITKAIGTFSTTEKAATVYEPQPTVTSDGSSQSVIRSVPLVEALQPYRTTNTGYAPASVKSNSIGTDTIKASNVFPSTLTGAEVASLNISGKTVTFDTGTIAGWTISSTELVGPLGSSIRSVQTAFDTGVGFFLGNSVGTPKFSIGDSTGDKMTWDGSYLRVTGNLTLSSAFLNKNYATASLPTPPTTIGFNSPAGVE